MPDHQTSTAGPCRDHPCSADPAQFRCESIMTVGPLKTMMMTMEPSAHSVSREELLVKPAQRQSQLTLDLGTGET